MADQYTPTPVKTKSNGDVVAKIVDTGGSNVAGVDASNQLKVIAGSNSGVDIGDVTINNASGASAVNIQDGGNSITVDGTVTTTIGAGATSIGKAEDVASADADVGVPAMAIRKATPANTSGTDGDYEMLQMSAGRLWTSSTIDAALPAGSNVIGALTANQSVNVAQVNGATTAVNNGTASTGTQRVAIASDNTPFTVKVSKDTSANATTNPIYTQLTDGTNVLGTAGNPLEVTFEGNAAGTLADTGDMTSAALAAGASANLSATAVTSGTAKFLALTASSSVRIKVELQTFVSSSATTVRTFFVDANSSLAYETKDRDAITFAGGSGNLFRLKITNMDNALAADVYGSITQENV